MPRTSTQTPITLLFSTPIGLTPGTTYYLEPVGLLGGGLINQSGYQYAGGTLFLDAVPNQQGFDMWFREGTIVPEPSTFGLLIVTGLALLGWRRCRGSVRQPG